jgi:hypothetical protein
MESKIVPVVHEEAHVEPFRPSGLVAGLKGEFGPEDLRTPWLSIIHATSQSSQQFPRNVGDLLYNKTVIVPRPITISIYGVEKNYQQNIQWDSNIRPQRYATKEEVLTAGGNLTQNVTPGADPNNYVAVAFCRLCLETVAPKKGKSWADPIEMAVRFEDKILIPAMFPLRGSSYRQLIPQLLSIEGNVGKAGKEIGHVRFSLDVTRMKLGSNLVYVPVLTKLLEYNSEAQMEVLRSIFGDAVQTN